MTASLRAGKVVTLPTVGLFADGAAVKTVGQETFKVCHELVDEMITVQTGTIYLQRFSATLFEISLNIKFFFNVTFYCD